jgi:alginate O-acetyltransferase complex protein AlgI
LPAYAPPAAALLALFTDNALVLPLGISYFTFRFLHYVVESRRGTLPEHDFSDFLCYATLFTIFPAGPIERFGHFAPQTARPVFDQAHLSEGLARILSGSIKKVIVADLFVVMFIDSLGRVSTEFDGRYSWRSQLAWLFGRLLLTYVDFSGYTDMAVGTTRLFGIRTMENFDRPLLKTDISDFWRAWHMSLTGWCRDYIYFPVFGLTRNPKIAVYASMVVLGAWHGTRWGWLVWGAWQATGLAVWQLWQVRKRKWAWLKRASDSPAYLLAAWALTLTWVSLGAAWTSFDTLGMSARFIVDTILLR